MAIEFQTVRVNFAQESGEIGTFSRNSAPFSGRIRRAQTAINGFDLFYENGDHHVLRMMVELNNAPEIVGASGNVARVSGQYLLRDSSGHIDDPYDGWVDVLIIADVA